MPRETIGKSDKDGFPLEITWVRDNYVQIGAVMREPQTSEAPQDLVELIKTWENPKGMRGIFSTYDRDELNQLIRVLRRARDQAFGKDE